MLLKSNHQIKIFNQNIYDRSQSANETICKLTYIKIQKMVSHVCICIDDMQMLKLDFMLRLKANWQMYIYVSALLAYDNLYTGFIKCQRFSVFRRLMHGELQKLSLYIKQVLLKEKWTYCWSSFFFGTKNISVNIRKYVNTL